MAEARQQVCTRQSTVARRYGASACPCGGERITDLWVVNLPMPSQKSISRVHLIIEVGEVIEGDGVDPATLIQNRNVFFC